MPEPSVVHISGQPLEGQPVVVQEGDGIGSLRADIILAVVLTLICGAVAYLLAGGLPAIGIDDAAITRSYAENVALGNGYVYYIGGERVEGSTAILWVGLLAALYALSGTPELAIIGLCAGFTGLTILSAIRLTGWLTLWLSGDVTLARRVLAFALLASPGYFMWSIWTMMELAMWSAAIMGLVLCLGRIVETGGHQSHKALAVFVALALPLIRPEGIVVGVGLGFVALCLSLRNWRVCVGVMVAAAASCAILTAFRISYFGQPFPNTFYAKVSSDFVEGLKSGLHYLVDFILRAPFAEVLLIICTAMAIVAIWRLRRELAGGRALTLLLLTILGALLVYAVLGGDHFVLWRFYQPVVPLFLVVLGVSFGVVVPNVAKSVGLRALTGAGIVALLVCWVHYVQLRFKVQSEFALVATGTAFGQHLSKANPLPVIGVGPAGGIALAYDGPIRDLLGLNWVEMAHANPIKVGMRNHASFDLATYWRHAPDVVATFNRACTRDTPDNGFDGLFQSTRFRAEYVPVRFTEENKCWPGYATPEWASNVDLPGLEVLDWSVMPKFGG